MRRVRFRVGGPDLEKEGVRFRVGGSDLERKGSDLE